MEIELDEDEDEDGENDKEVSLVLSAALNSTDTLYPQTEWRLVSETGYLNLRSVTLSAASWMDVGTTQFVSLVLDPLDATFGDAIFFDWVSANEAVATVSETGKITALAPGYTHITAKHRYTGNNDTITIVVGNMIPNSVYQIRNMDSGLYMRTTSSAASNSIELMQYNEGVQQDWEIIYDALGYYYIRSVQTGKYLGVSEDNPSVIVQTNTQNDYSKWKILMSNKGKYKFIAKATESSSLVLASTAANVDGQLFIQQAQYADDEIFADEWFFYYDAVLLGLSHSDGGARDAYFQKVLPVLENTEGVRNCLTIYASNFEAEEMKTLMSNSKLFMIHTHGSKGTLSMGNESMGIGTLKLMDLTQSQLMIFMSCSGGEGGYDPNRYPSNMVEAATMGGARSALAFSQTTYTDHIGDWVEDLFFEMHIFSLGLSDAIAELNDLGNEYNETQEDTAYDLSDVAVVGGDETITLYEIFS